MKARPSAQKLYLRQVHLADIDTKFFEKYLAFLADIFDVALGLESEGRPRGRRALHKRYGLLYKPRRVRFRILDPELSFAGIADMPDIQLDEGSFAALNLPVTRVFVTENETNFLSFPPVASAIVVFGAGYGLKAFGSADWIRNLPLYYWGDIDTHGFAILGELRAIFPHASGDAPTNREQRQHRNACTSRACICVRLVKPFMLVVARDTTHADEPSRFRTMSGRPRSECSGLYQSSSTQLANGAAFESWHARFL